MRATSPQHSPAHARLLQSGFLIAYPSLDPFNHTLEMNIEGWSTMHRSVRKLAVLSMASFGEWRSEFDVPMRILSVPFIRENASPSAREGVKFNDGGIYQLNSEWDYPVYGERVGAFVVRVS